MGKEKKNTRQKTAGKVNIQKNQREKIRWLMVVYDTVIYFLSWLAILVVQPSMTDPIAMETAWFYFGVGYVALFGWRFAFRSYNQIWRYGAIQTFAREILAGALGVVTTVALSRIPWVLSLKTHIPFTLLTLFLAVYIISSIFVRVLYCYLYRFAMGDSHLARMMRRIIEVAGWVDFDSKDGAGTLHLVLEPEKHIYGPINELQNIADQFAIRGDITAITQLNKGYINRTYRVETLSDTGNVHLYTLQRINTNVFPDADALMSNFKLTTEHLFGRLVMPGRHKRGSVQTHRPTKDGRAFLRDDSGCWRMLTHFDGVYSLDIPDSPKTFYHAGCAFGKFLKEMSDVDINEVKVVIPNFHNTESRYRDLEAAIAKDPKGRVASVEKEIEFVRARVDKFGMISEPLERGELPLRICHNDTNLNNILFDNQTHLPVAIIDLDTVMPSSPLYDFGDSMRIGTNTAKDDEKDLSKVSCDLTLFEQYARGYLEACGDILTQRELELLPYAAIIITAEDGIRFLMDHINGDTYYNIYYPGQNLDRARTQLKLVEDMEKKMPQIKQILREIYKDLGLKANIT